MTNLKCCLVALNVAKQEEAAIDRDELLKKIEENKKLEQEQRVALHRSNKV